MECKTESEHVVFLDVDSKNKVLWYCHECKDNFVGAGIMLIFEWYFYSRIVLFFSWLNRQAGWLWRRMSKDRASYWFDVVPGWTASWYYKSLNEMVAKTGKNLYGDKLC